MIPTRALSAGVSCKTSTAALVASGKEPLAEELCRLTVGFGGGLGRDSQSEAVGVAESGLDGFEVNALVSEPGGVGAA